VTVVAISKDTPEDSRVFAAADHLPFVLLTDADGAVSRTYSGVTSDSNTLPGIVLVRHDGRIAFRQVATAKDDRMSTAELFATIDRTLGTHGPAADHAGYVALDRVQLRFDLGGGALLASDGPHARGATGSRGTGIGMLGMHVPLARYLMIGARADIDRDEVLAVDALATLRAPLWRGAGALELSGGPGYGIEHGTQATGGVGLWFAWAPTWSLQLSATAIVRDPGTELVFTLGIASLIRAPWR